MSTYTPRRSTGTPAPDDRPLSTPRRKCLDCCSSRVAEILADVFEASVVRRWTR